MARQKALDKYPHEYVLMFRSANERDLVIACDSPSQAWNLRNDLYAYRSALIQEGSDEAVNEARNVRLSIRDATLLLEPIRRKDNGTQTQS